MATYLRPFPAAAAAFADATRWLRFCACALALGATVASAQQVKDIFPASTQLPNAVLGKFYSITLTAVTEPAGLPVDWNTDEGCLDGSGLEFIFPDGSSNATTIQGTASTLGTFECTVTATIFLDTGNSFITKTYMVRVVSPCTPPQITSGGLPPVTADASYVFGVMATGTLPLTFSAMGLPAGLTLNPVSGVIAGTPHAAGSYPVSIMVAGCGPNALQDLTLVVSAPPPPPPAVVALSLTSQPNPAVFGQPVTALAHASGGAVVPTGNVLLCVVAPGQFCAAPVGAPPPGTDPSLLPPLLTAPLDANGNATFTLNGLLIQNFMLSASYGGDATHQPATAGPIDQFVIKGLLLPPTPVAARPSQGDPPAPAAPIPTLSWAALALLALAIAGVVAVRLRRRPLGG